MASKRKVTSTDELEQSSSESDDSDVVPLGKRNKTNVSDNSHTDDSQGSSSKCPSTRTGITEDEMQEQPDLFDFLEVSVESGFPREAKPIEYFNLFFNSSLWALMVEETNSYAEELLHSPQVSTRSRMKEWKPVSVLEMKAFVAVLLEMGITRRPTIFSYWAENSRNIPWFKQMFPRNRFQLILRCFHLVNNKECFPPGHESYDPCAKFNPIVQYANKVLKKRAGKEKHTTKPYIIDDYNSIMEGGEKSDKMLYTYLDEGHTLKYWKKMTFNIFSQMVLNSYLLYKKTEGIKAMSRLKFTSSIITEIEGEWLQEKKHQLPNEKKAYGLMKLPGRNLRQCVVCSSKASGIKRSNLICIQCKKGLHPLCFDKHVCYTH